MKALKIVPQAKLSIVDMKRNKFAIQSMQKENLDRYNNAIGKYIGTVDAVMDEKRRRDALEKQYRFVVFPDSSFRKNWDGVVVLCLVYVALYTPYQVAFLGDTISFDNLQVWIVMFTFDRFTDFVFLFDMLVNFRAATMDSAGKVSFNGKAAAVKYLKSWFFIDLVSILPYDIMAFFVQTDPTAVKLPKLLKMFRLIKIVKVMNASKIFKRYEQSISVKYGWIRLFQFAIGMLVISHWFGCFIYLSSTFAAAGSKTWLDDLDDAVALSPQEFYFASVYWAVMTLTTIGYGDITAHNTFERIIFSGFMVVGAALYAYIVGTMCSLVQGLDAHTIDFQKKMDETNEFMDTAHLPHELRARVRKYMLYIRDAKVAQGIGVLQLLTPSIRRDVVLFKFHDVLTKIPQFHDAPKSFLASVGLAFQSAVFGPNELIITAGVDDMIMYVLNKGRVQVETFCCDGKIKVTDTMSEGSYFGVRSLLFRSKQQASIRSLAYCQTMSLERSDLDAIMVHYPDVHHMIRLGLAKELIKRTLRTGKLRELANDENFLKAHRRKFVAVRQSYFEKRDLMARTTYRNLEFTDFNSKMNEAAQSELLRRVNTMEKSITQISSTLDQVLDKLSTLRPARASKSNEIR